MAWAAACCKRTLGSAQSKKIVRLSGWRGVDPRAEEDACNRMHSFSDSPGSNFRYDEHRAPFLASGKFLHDAGGKSHKVMCFYDECMDLFRNFLKQRKLLMHVVQVTCTHVLVRVTWWCKIQLLQNSDDGKTSILSHGVSF